MSRGAFVRALGWIFEGSPWVAEAVVDRRRISAASRTEHPEHGGCP
ncbi:MAG: hypothetical protein QN163_07570 [Armatimonadota bacterium]|nr:hypothetical protein [Armatimonadota bacterium]MDR5696178.1 hypothetical protein [Armatimonadota bacterium]